MSAWDRPPKGTAPCPYCGSTDIVVRYSDKDDVIYWYVRCENCEATGPDAEGQYCVSERLDCIEAWNRRTQ